MMHPLLPRIPPSARMGASALARCCVAPIRPVAPCRMMPISLTLMHPFLSCPAAANSEGEAGPVNCHAPSYRLFDLRF